jgi:hypothetical protein
MKTLHSHCHAALGIALLLSTSGAICRESSSSISVSAIVLPSYAESLVDATITVTNCATTCAERGIRPDSMPGTLNARMLSAMEKEQLTKGGIAALSAALRATAPSGMTIVNLDF